MEVTGRPAKRPSQWDIQLSPDSRPATVTINEVAKLLSISRGLA